MTTQPKKLRPKEKTAAWEKRRRNRINENFKKLWEVLPDFDPSRPLSKPDILIQAASYIEDLKEKVHSFLTTSETHKPAENVGTEIIKKLQDRVKKLLLRNEELLGALNKSGVKKVPSTAKTKRKKCKYEQAITGETAKMFQEQEKENQEKPVKKSTKKIQNKSQKPRKPRKTSAPNTVFLNNSCIFLSKPSQTNSFVTLVKTPIVSSSIKPSIFPAPITIVPFIPAPPMQIVTTPKSAKRVLGAKSNRGNKVAIRPLKGKPKKVKSIKTEAKKEEVKETVKQPPKNVEVETNVSKANDIVGKVPTSAAGNDGNMLPPKISSSIRTNDNLLPNPPSFMHSFEAAPATTTSATYSDTTITTDINKTLQDLKTLETDDIFASFQVPPGCQNPESTSPTAAFLLAFPLVSSGVKVSEVIGDENSESHSNTPNLMQIGTMDGTKTSQSYVDNLTPSFDSLSFFGSKECGFYNPEVKPKSTGDFWKPQLTPTYNKPKTEVNFDYNKRSYCRQDKTSKPVNWMTTPATTSSYFLPPCTTTFSNTFSDLFSSYSDENAFSWSPNKLPLLDSTPSFMSSTLPTLVGDLALNNTPFDKKQRRKSCENSGASSFFSVSQLMEDNPGKITQRRTSGNRTKPFAAKSKPKPAADKRAKPSSYSAEALISDKRPSSCQKSMVPTYFNDNLYFPSLETDTYQNYQPTFQSQDFAFDSAPKWQKQISCKKAKKRSDPLPPFDLHFLSMPGTINSPILPDDFHTTYIPPTTLYSSCKNNLYKAGSEQTGGNSLANFNLSTIFPEINKQGLSQDGFATGTSQQSSTFGNRQ